ncbi:hypothetical protein [Virgisporangium ochraceum]|uniref:Uncharacterized protein n=1 Tax=Virgisporangium ochraceum TaxID=65505 RepID=A0A8J4EF24_9ACTN|nr:hypothetical protein [Virgisporangium ochraceum]GIJ72369.1 hypothetical protein Voc01_072860 [Virgisporangium ochraceum]
MTENRYPEADPNRDRSRPLWPERPAVPPMAAGPPMGAGRPWARRLATVAAAVVLSLGGGAVLGAAAVRWETDTVAVAGVAPDGSVPEAASAGSRFDAATVVVRVRGD